MASSNPTAPAAVDDTDALVHERNGVLTLAVSTAGALAAVAGRKC